MDLRKKTDAQMEFDSKVKTEYIEEDVGDVMKNCTQAHSGIPDAPPPRYFDQNSPQTPEGGHLFSPFAHPFYHPISAFSFVSLPPSLPRRSHLLLYDTVIRRNAKKCPPPPLK